MRPPALLVAAAVVVMACRQPTRRAAGDEVPYPPVDEAALDRNADPCQDFYRFACGGWLAESPVPPDRTRWTRGSGEVEERNARLLRRILEDAGAGKVGAQERFGRKAGDFYAACMDEPDVEASGLAELQAEWARLDAVSDRFELAEELSRLAAMGIRAPLGVRAWPDPRNPARNLLVIGGDGAGLAQRRPEEGGAPQARGAPTPGPGQLDPVADHVRAMLRLGGVPAAQLDADAAAAVALLRALEGSPPASGAELQRLDRAALERAAPAFPWGPFLRALGAGRIEAFGVGDASVARASQAFATAPLGAWKAYLRVRLAEDMAAERALPAPLVQEWFRLQAALGPAPSELRPRWKHCVGATARTFAFAAGGTFARRHLKASGRDRAGSLVSDLERGMLVTVESAPWIDPPTQSRAAAKLERMVAEIGYPDGAPDYGSLRVGRDSYFRNVLSAGRYAVAQEVARAVRPVDRGEWLVGPFASEPRYWPERNVLCVPAGALQPPLYTADAPPPVVFGAMGSSVGRTLAAALEGPGRMWGPDGGAGDWWTPAAAKAFEAWAACLVDQFGGYEAAPGAWLDGRRTLASNLDDLAGVRAAYEAMRAERIAHPGPEQRVQGFTPDQQFFLGYAQSLCTAVTEADLADQIARGTSAPARFRVNGPLSNLPEFARAFRCAEGTPMVRPKAARCDVW